MAARARRRKVLRPDRPPKANARSPPDQMDCFSSPAPRWLLGLRNVVLLALLVIYNDETTYTYRPSDAVAVRTSHGDDARAGRLPWHGGLGEVLPGTIGLRVVHFLPIRQHHRTRLLRPGSTVSAVADQRGGLAQSSWARRLARVAGHRPQPPGSRVVSPRGLTTSTEFRSFFNPSVTNTPREFHGAPHIRLLVVRSERGREARRSRRGGSMTPLENGALPGR
mgnify:CR=1 FL=1